ncbi:MAG: ATP phosphoribosyltransferase regulatory subunit [Arenicellales bacterium WSBS_2016_MAG_OTU3]
MVSSLQLGGVKNLHVDIGHIGIFSALANAANLDAFIKQKMFDALQRKSTPEITEVCELAGLNAESRSWFETLATLFGTGESIEEAVQCLNCREADVVAAVKQLRDFISLVQQRMPDLAVHFDMPELRGYEYHTGLIFSVFVEGHGREIARGGRYDDVGKAFGRATDRPPDLVQTCVRLCVTGLDQKATARAVLAPNLDDESLRTAVLKLRASGERVVTALPESMSGAIEDDSQITSSFDRQLVKQGGNWIIQPLQQKSQ